MRILFDHGTPAPLQSFFTDNSVYKAKDLGWDTLSNGELLKAAEEAGFDVLLTTDKNIRFQQNLSKFSIAVVVLGNPTWPMLSPYVKRVIEAVISAKPGSYCEVDIPER
jgi:hypothetical protein